MRNIRIIPRLDIKGPNLVKGIHLEGLRVLGRPEQYAKYYYEQGADELIYVDVVASLYNRNSIHEIISKTAKEIFIPLTVGGGIRTIEDIRRVLRAGADKVALNTAAIKNPRIVREASRIFGSSTIVAMIEAMKQPDGKYLAFTDNGRNFTGLEVKGWAKDMEKLGAGEIVITSIDREGTGRGFDIELTRMIADAVSLPIIAHGGAGKVEDVFEVIKKGSADAVALSSVLHYSFLKNHKADSDFDSEGNIEFLKSGKAFSLVKTANLRKIKNFLIKKKINCRAD